jgi:hypothetical protein
MAGRVKKKIFSVEMSYISMEVHQLSEGTFCLHLLRRTTQESINTRVAGRKSSLTEASGVDGCLWGSQKTSTSKLKEKAEIVQICSTYLRKLTRNE